MFKQVISNTALTTDAANSFFSHIDGASFRGDVSFVSSLRALVAPRMKDDENLSLSFHQSSYSESQLNGFSNKKVAIQMVFDSVDYDNGSVLIHSFISPSGESNAAWMKMLETSFVTVYPDWYRLEKVTDFFKKTFNTLCFINPNTKQVVIFTENLDIRKMHYLQCSIFAFLPWYFDPKQGVSKLEMELIESLRSKDSAQYEECISKIAEQYDFRTAKIKHLLRGFETKHEQRQCESVREQIQCCLNSIDSLNNQIGEWLERKRDFEISLLGLETKIANSKDDSEIMDYFIRNTNLVLDDVNNTSITFTVKAYLEYFDEDYAERVINNKGSYIYHPSGRDCSNIIAADDMEKLMTAIFIDQRLRIRLCATYCLDMFGRVTALTSPNTPELRGCMPNTHIDRYHCLGNYNRAIVEMLKRHDYIGAVEQCAASCKSLNFHDSPVMNEFMLRMYGVSSYQSTISIKCIELPDGDVVMPIDAIKWLKSHEEDATNE